MRLPTLKTGEGPSMVVSLSKTILRWKVAKQSSLVRGGVRVGVGVRARVRVRVRVRTRSGLGSGEGQG